MTNPDTPTRPLPEPETNNLVPSVLMGIHYEVRPDVVVRWYEPGTTMAARYGIGWHSEEMSGFDEIPLTDVIVLSRWVADGWRAFCRGNVIVTRTVEDHLDAALSAFDAAQEGTSETAE